MESSILTLLIFIPVAGAILMLPFAMVYGKENAHYYRGYFGRPETPCRREPEYATCP